ncbi:MAG TPA: arginine--tRNA ligase [bacterium]|nr:arginine--tRNA ligase [bacterium]
MSKFPDQPDSTQIHKRGTSTKNYILTPGSLGLQIRDAIVSNLRSIWLHEELNPKYFPIVEIEHPADLSHGDWACSIALQLAKILKQNPFEIATELAELVGQDNIAGIAKIEVIKPGFINFHLSAAWLAQQTELILKQAEKFGQVENRVGKTIMIEHTQPNTHKALHVGHLRNTVLGMAEVRLHRAVGYEVISTTYGGDVGPHIAKCIYGLRGEDLTKYPTLDDQIKLLADSYVKGGTEESEAAEEEMKRINKALYEQSDEEINTLWEITREWSIAKQKEIYVRVGTELERFYWESEVWRRGVELIQQNMGTVFTESQGAIIFEGERYGLHTRVFMTGQGTPTYEGKELGLESLKMEEYDFDFNVIQVGNDHEPYFSVVIKALEEVFPDKKGVFESEHFGMVSIPSGKMSSRTGNVIFLEDILNEMHERAYAEVDKRYPDLPAEKKNALAETIGIGATKYALLKYDPRQDITFDPEQTLSFTGDSGAYLQYVCVRIQSLLEKAQQQHMSLDAQLSTLDFSQEELTLLRKLYRLPEIIIHAQLEYKPNHLCSYLFDLAQTFNDFYQACPVLNAEKQEIVAARLFLCQATLQVLRNGLAVLGIAVPEKM